MKLSPIESMVKEGNEIKEFNRHLFETMVEKVIVGEGDDPYKIKFFLKTKQQYNVNAAKYILKNKVGKTIKGITYQQASNRLCKTGSRQIQQHMWSASRCYAEKTSKIAKKGLKNVKIGTF